MEKVRAKFYVGKVEQAASQGDVGRNTTITMFPVYSDDPKSENKAFCQYTPSGEFKMLVTVPETAAFFESGQEYYLDFTKAKSI